MEEKQKPLVKSITFWLGLAIAVFPLVLEYFNANATQYIPILTLIGGILVIVNRYLSPPSKIKGFLK